jgi:thiamine kinase-like enzyme
VGAVGELNEILRGLVPSLGPLGGQPVALEGGITNRNFRVAFGEGEYVVRLHGKDTSLLGISREAEALANETAAGLGIAPPVAARFDGGLVTGYVACEPLGESELAARVEEVAVALRAFHRSGLRLPSRFWVPDLLADYERIVGERGGETPPGYERASETAKRIATVLAPEEPSPCHNDLLGGNLIKEREHDRIMIVDWEYAGMGHPYFDLGNLSVNNDLDEATDERLLWAYLQQAPSERELATLKLMRVLSDVREAAWGVMQAQVSDLAFDFDGYAGRHFERLDRAAKSSEFEGWLAAAEG